MTRPTVFLTHSPEMLADYYGERAVAALREVADLRLNETGRVLDEAALAREARGAQIVVSDRQTPGFGSFFEGAPDLVAFLRCAVDIRNVDVEAASRLGILCTRATPGFMTAVAEMAMGYMLDLARQISEAVLDYRAGREPPPRIGRELNGASLGIIGWGRIARELAPLAVAFGMNVRVADPYAKVEDRRIEQVGMDELLGSSDFVCCLALATEETENLMDSAAFARMRGGAYFLNLSRGNLVDEAALAAALESGHLAGAALDVGRDPDQKPPLALASRPNVIATPHTAGMTPQAVEHQAFDTVRQVRALVHGEVPDNAVNAEKATRLSRLRRK